MKYYKVIVALMFVILLLTAPSIIGGFSCVMSVSASDKDTIRDLIRSTERYNRGIPGRDQKMFDEIAEKKAKKATEKGGAFGSDIDGSSDREN